MRAAFTRRDLLAGGGLLAGAGALTAGGGGALVGDLLGVRAASALAGPPGPDEDGHELWLRYRLVDRPDRLSEYRRGLTHVVVAASGKDLSTVVRSAADELVRGLSALTGRDVRKEAAVRRDGAVVLGTPDSSDLVRSVVERDRLRALGPEGYVLLRRKIAGHDAIVVASEGERGVLYGAFDLLRRLQTHQDIRRLNVRERPMNALRLADHWDNLDRSVERGYAGPSIFHWDDLPEIEPHYVDYARALASVGMNGTVVNNVNASPAFLDSDLLERLRPLQDVLRQWGVTLYLSANFACPIVLGGLPTADPFDADVRAWWRDKAREIYEKLPGLGGFLVKADSEGQPGPLTYGRTHADGANLLAGALEPYGGIVMWRAFVHDFDSRTWAHESYDTFQPLDGEFADNVVVQIKNGPIDFQVREPVHPLFGALPRTNSMMELQITQEYTGQSTHLCYLVPMWKEVYDFDTHAEGPGTTVADIVSGETYGYSHSGVAGVMNFGSDVNWTRHHLAAANTHGFGRLAWNPGLEPEHIAREWIGMTFGPEPRLEQVLGRMLLSSWQVYESYTSPLGVGFMIAGDHFTPSPETNQSWHQADENGTGFDRTIATGSGYTGYYHPPVTRLYESLESCPDELLLFMHHVPYGHRLHSGKTVVQHIYDSHFEGREDVERMRRLWRSLDAVVDARRHREIAERFDAQVHQATLWRDSVVRLYFEHGRVLDEKRTWVQLRPAGAQVLLGGWPGELELVAGNASPDAREITVGLEPEPGWEADTVTVSLGSREFGEVAVPVTPPLTPALTTVRADVDAGGSEVLGRTIDVFTAPVAARCLLALDAGPATGQVLTGYRRLSPADTWDEQQGYGWVGEAPQSRDRGRLDVLRRDFVNDTEARTLRIAVPPGVHRTYLLLGDAGADCWPTYVRSEGKLLAQSEFLLGGVFAWVPFDLDGGPDGRTVDLELSSGGPDLHWHLGALVIPDPDAGMPPVVVTEIRAEPPLLIGRPHAVTVQLMNTTESEIEVTGRLAEPASWEAGEATVTVPASGTVALEVEVVPAGDPVLTTLRLEVTSAGGPVSGALPFEVVAVPAADDVALALDAGTAGSPLVAGYRRLSPDDAWSAERGYGWVGTRPTSRDREVLDPLRRDFVNDSSARTLRIAVPAGRHEVFVLVGDGTQPSAPTYVRSDGTLLAESARLGTGEFTWIRFVLDGGASGRTVDLELSSEQGEHWHLNALLVR